mgnify:CR=1 FL=1
MQKRDVPIPAPVPNAASASLKLRKYVEEYLPLITRPWEPQDDKIAKDKTRARELLIEAQTLFAQWRLRESIKKAKESANAVPTSWAFKVAAEGFSRRGYHNASAELYKRALEANSNEIRLVVSDFASRILHEPIR